MKTESPMSPEMMELMKFFATTEMEISKGTFRKTILTMKGLSTADKNNKAVEILQILKTCGTEDEILLKLHLK